jgi:hypothetical protein
MGLLRRFRQRPGKKFLRCLDRLTIGVRLRDAEGAPLRECSPPASVQSGKTSV